MEGGGGGEGMGGEGEGRILLLVCTKLGSEDVIEESRIDGIRKVFTIPWFQGL